MERRRFLAAAGAAGLTGLAGCKGAVAPGVGRTLLGPDTDERRISLAAVDGTPDEAAVAITVEVVEPLANADQPARIRLTTANEGPARAVSVAPDGCSLFNRLKAGSDDPAGLWLYPPDALGPADRTGRRWVPSDRGARGKALYGCDPHRYGVGGSVTNEYEVWDDYQVRGYLPPGTYRWEESVEVYRDPRADAADDPDVEFVWGFSLDVTVPG